jgi:hypothetical protein
MRIKLIKDWPRKGRIVKRGTVMTVTTDLGKRLINNKFAREGDYAGALDTKDAPRPKRKRN